MYSSVPYFEWMRKNKNYRENISSIFENDNSFIWSIMNRKNTQILFRNFLKRKNRMHKFLVHLIDFEITLRLFLSLIDRNEEVIVKSDSLEKEEKLKIKINLESYKKFISDNNSF